MIKTVEIENTRTGARRRFDYTVPDPSDPPEVKEMFARHPPAPHVVIELGVDERVVNGAMPE